MEKKLKHCRDKGKLVRIQRDKSVDPNGLYGFILDYSKSLILLAYDADFRADGWKIIPRSFVTSIRVTRSCEYWKQIMKKEGLLGDLEPGFPVDLTDLQAGFESLKKQRQFVIVQDEHSDVEEFLIGPIRRVSDRSISIRHFDGTGKWVPGRHTIAYENITMVQFGCDYIRLHEKYIKMKG